MNLDDFALLISRVPEGCELFVPSSPAVKFGSEEYFVEATLAGFFGTDDTQTVAFRSR